MKLPKNLDTVMKHMRGSGVLHGVSGTFENVPVSFSGFQERYKDFQGVSGAFRFRDVF